MSNIFLSTSFIFLASEAAGCLDEKGKVADSCEASVFGMRPASLVANIAILSGVLSSLFMPVAGAMVDYTPYRRRVGCASALLMISIQVIQIGTTSQTWFVMAILQGIAGFVYQVQVLATYAYLPDIARSVGETTMTGCEYSTSLHGQYVCVVPAASNESFVVICTHSPCNLHHGAILVARSISRRRRRHQSCAWLQRRADRPVGTRRRHCMEWPSLFLWLENSSTCSSCAHASSRNDSYWPRIRASLADMQEDLQ